MTEQPGPAHLGTDALADFVAGVGTDADAAHVAACERCRASVARLGEASTAVTARLAALPDPALPAAYAQRFTDALSRESAGREQAVAAPSRATSRARVAGWWGRRPRLRMAVVAAAAVVLVGGGGSLLVTGALDRSDTGGPSVTGAATAPTPSATPDSTPRSPATPSTHDRPLLAPDAAVALDRRSLGEQTAGLLHSRPIRSLDPVPACVRSALAGTAEEGEALATVRGRFSLDGEPVRLVFADDQRVAIVVSGCAAGATPAVAARVEVAR